MYLICATVNIHELKAWALNSNTESIYNLCSCKHILLLPHFFCVDSVVLYCFSGEKIMGLHLLNISVKQLCMKGTGPRVDVARKAWQWLSLDNILTCKSLYQINLRCHRNVFS